MIKTEKKITKNISYILQFIENTRFMASLLSNLVNNLADGIHRTQCKLGHDDKNCETYAIKYKYCDCFLEYANFKDDLIEYKCLSCNKSYQQNLTKSKKKYFLIHTNFLTMITISLFYYYQKVVILRNIWMIKKN